MTLELEVVAAVVRDSEQILACRRAPGKAAAGRWEFPGGKVEPGEEPRAALKRELLEELGVHVQIGALLIRSQTLVGELIIDLAAYEARLLNNRPIRSTDHDLLEWLSLGDLEGLDWASPDVPVVEALVATDIVS
ncbi:(deoxy)nucleoside triphosphate pyrophosphohydrolase [Agromyces sp. MMS24-K17]|uniref:(deoxy)nucleoside triphosphate pyrophosphohydrolase n=1 Tax=Agromyces sp. MMS24-K17 TaxID=3372850 RepID=UPI003754C58C